MDGISDADYMPTSDEVTEVLRKHEGFIRRELMKNGDGQWVDIAYWANPELGKKAEASLHEDAVIAKAMKMLNMETMVFTHVQPVKSYQVN